MTGWRIGYAGGPADIIKAMKKIQSQSTSNPTSISQYAAEAALNGRRTASARCWCSSEAPRLRRRRLNGIAGIECLATDGTFYVFPSVKG